MDVQSCSSSAAGVGSAQSLFLLLLQTLYVNQCAVSSSDVWPKDYFPQRKDSNEYDFIVVGAGTAGSIVASRLSENKKWKVLLIEAGGDPPIESNIPLLTVSTWNTEYDWKFKTEPSDNYGRALTEAPLWPRGKMLGGSSSLNCMIHLRGFPYDYDRWEALGNDGWGYASVLPVFERMEQNMALNGTANPEGLLKIDYTYTDDKIRYIIADAAKEFGYPWVKDFNNGDQIGYTNTQANIHKGIRQSSARAYLVPAAKRKNLHVIKFAHVTKLIMKGNKVVGVDFRRGRHGVYTAQALKEVILSAGTVGTPPILMHSGIGPKKHLQKMGIQVIKDLSVGKNLQDHVMVPLLLSVPLFSQVATKEQTMDMVYQYLKTLSGPMSTTGIDFIGMLNTKEGPKAERPNVEQLHIVMEPGSSTLPEFFKQQLLQKHHLQQLVDVNKKSTIVHVVTSLSNPKSHGKIELRNRDPLSPPKIYPNYLDHDDDLQIMADAVKFQYGLEETKAFKAAGAKYVMFSDIGCPNLPSKEYFECYARQFGTTLFHPVGTAKMGPDTDEDAVVDHLLRVRGIRRLRVCDASVMPVIPSVNVNAAASMIGERCAEFIKDKYQ